MTSSLVRRGFGGALLLLPFAISACGGGGGGGAGGNSNSFILIDVKYGRLVDDGTGPKLLSPLTTVTLDPVTGKVVPGSIEGLAPEVDISIPQTFAIGADYLPRVVPRNGVLQLEFSAPVDAASITGDVVDVNGNVLTAGSVQVRLEDGRGIPVTLTQPSPTMIWINPVSADSIGFPPSPVDFGPSGDPRADATGYLKLIVPPEGVDGSGNPTPVLRSTRGATLGTRVSDHLGTLATPIGFNPGNRVLDFIAQNQLIPTGETFNGFLPDIAPPRITRTVSYSHLLSFGAGDSSTFTQIVDVSASFSTAAKNGLGEWATARLTLRPGLPNQEVHTVRSNTNNSVTITDSFSGTPQDGDTYLLERAEFYEPDLNDPIDPDHFDPNDPENANNSDLTNFVEAWEVDVNGNAVNGPLSLRNSIPPFSELRVRFSEPVASESFGAYEDFQVRFDPDQGAGSEILSQIVLDPSQTTVKIRPALEDQSSGTFQIVGWGRNLKTLRFEITTVPKPGYLQQHLTSDQVNAFLDQGFRSVVDLGGQPLAFPNSLFNAANPVITYSIPFTSDETKSSQVPPPVVSSWGVIVHRMQGRPVTGIDPATGNPGVKYVDQPNYYSPIADVNLQANGYLAGSPVVYLTKIHDDYFPPPHGQFGAFPLGSSTPLMSFLPPPPPTGPQPHDGARFQTVYRDIDASPSRDALAGTLLDLYRLSWAPIGGNVTTDNYQDISVHCAHSPLRPMTNQNGANATNPYYGLGQPFDFDSWKSIVDPTITDACPAPCSQNVGPNYWDSLVTVVPPGTPYKVTQSSLFAPPFDGHPYCPWPTFTTRFQYNNGDIPQAEKDLRTAMNNAYDCSSAGSKIVWYETRIYNPDPDADNLGGDSLLVEIRIRQQQTNISRLNGFLIDSAPRFRAYSLGSPGLPVNPDDITNDVYARCAKGNTSVPNLDGIPGDGDNDRYFALFDYVKTTSIITSPYVKVYPGTTIAPDFYPPIVEPSLADQPDGTQVTLEFQGANSLKGASGTGFSTDVNIADGRSFIAFRATLVGNITTTLLPNFDLIVIPYLRPQGD
jgi:hypothetical protein